jgi:hypothetical protein
MMDDKQPSRQINVELPEKESEGIYSNMAFMMISPQEFIIDFARIMPGLNKAKVYSRIIMTPAHAKMLHKTLEDNIKKYESDFGQIKVYGQEEKNIGFKQENK